MAFSAHKSPAQILSTEVFPATLPDP